MSRHVEVDAEQHLDLVRRVGVLRTPTTLVLDAEGREVSRAAGAPTKQAVIASLGRVRVSPSRHVVRRVRIPRRSCFVTRTPSPYSRPC